MIDWSRVAELRDEIGAEDFQEVVDLFLDEVAGALAELQEAAEDPGELEARLHFLKGSALNLGFAALSELCHHGETAARRGATGGISLDRVADVYERSRAEFLRELPQRLTA
ncbi:Hpt domain-containing protein [Salipiger thiooxidans]|uniref:Hpt domain-containing protein n=1 Tax=Salipiger thiooxidans TaxID=282683 RepID=A0A1G7CIU7_9RHOB|nr:Hpt domain-containing protein [Salipiger thiooxidans]SDE39257.1 Hpt domain-containing protein [Salipiger thiooxidans]